MSDLRAAAQQALEALLSPGGAQACSTCQDGPENEYCCRREMWAAITALRATLARPEPDLSRCPQCGGPADNGHDRELPPNPYWCTRCLANARDDWK